LIDKTGDGGAQATERGRTVLTEMYKVSAEIADESRADKEGSLADLSNLAGLPCTTLSSDERITLLAGLAAPSG
jgi:hypothetical protein